ncbi:MAG: GntR family transcriptional regulator [Synergistaceae bacterium]|jgi:DNA-binding GntR family transcriptional regulator|nr:GntR family transcriptional regulator [Synergistaceae bacterium]
MTLYRSDPLRKQVYDYLRELLISGQLKAGDFINQGELTAKLGISRTPLRDSLMQLEAEGFVSIIPCRGVRINPLTRDAIKNIYQISGALEGAAFESVFRLVTEERLQELGGLIRETEALMNAGDFSVCHENNVTFHESILNLCGNDELLKMLRRSRQRLYHFPGVRTPDLSTAAAKLTSWEREYWAQHRRIVDLFRNGTPQELGHYIRCVHWDFDGVEDSILLFYQIQS